MQALLHRSGLEWQLTAFRTLRCPTRWLNMLNSADGAAGPCARPGIPVQSGLCGRLRIAGTRGIHDPTADSFRIGRSSVIELMHRQASDSS